MCLRTRLVNSARRSFHITRNRPVCQVETALPRFPNLLASRLPDFRTPPPLPLRGMDEILRNLAPGARVLDLGSLTGSFPADRCPNALVLRVDLEAPAPGTVDGFIQADAARLPFPDRSFDSV